MQFDYRAAAELIGTVTSYLEFIRLVFMSLYWKEKEKEKRKSGDLSVRKILVHSTMKARNVNWDTPCSGVLKVTVYL